MKKENQLENQIDMLDLGVNDQFDCTKCVWVKTYGNCYPKEKLGRQYFYKAHGALMCSDYGTKFCKEA